MASQQMIQDLFPLLILGSTLYPLNGVFNLLVYTRGTYIGLRRKKDRNGKPPSRLIALWYSVADKEEDEIAFALEQRVVTDKERDSEGSGSDDQPHDSNVENEHDVEEARTEEQSDEADEVNS